MREQPQNTGRQLVCAGEMRGTKVVNPQGEDLGKITDIVVDRERGATPYAVVSFGGVLGMGRHSVAVPMRAISHDDRSGNCMLAASKEQLERAPDFDAKNWDSLHDPSWLDKIGQAFGNSDDRQTGTGQPAERYILSSDLEGSDVVDDHGETAGSIQDIISNRSSGKIDFALLGMGGLAGIGADTKPVPWQALHRSGTNRFSVSMPRERIKEAPELGMEKVRHLEQPQFCDSVCSFYHVQQQSGPGVNAGNQNAQTRDFGIGR